MSWSKPGEVFTIRVRVEDPEKADEFFRAMQHDTLLAGCQVEAIARGADYFAERDDYKRYSEYLWEALDRLSFIDIEDLEDDEKVKTFKEFELEQNAAREERRKHVAERRAQKKATEAT